MLDNDFIPLTLAKQHARITATGEDIALAFMLKTSMTMVEQKTSYYLGFKRYFNEPVTIDRYGDGGIKYRPLDGFVNLRVNGLNPLRIGVKRTKFNINSASGVCGCESPIERSGIAEYESGFDCLSDAPQPVVLAAMLLFTWFYEKRGDEPVAKYVRKNSGGIASLYDNKAIEFCGAAHLIYPYESIGLS